MPDRLLLRLLNGPRAGESFEVPASGLLVGRQAGNDLQLDDPSLSGRHAFLRADGGQVAIEDLGSTNGTRIDGEKVERGMAAVGAVLGLGKLKFAVQEAAVDDESAPGEDGGSADGLAIEGLEEEEIVLGDEPEPEAPAMPAKSLPAAALPARSMPAEPVRPPSDTTAPGRRAPGVVEPNRPAVLDAPEEPELELDLEAAMARGGRSRLLPILALLTLLGAAGWYFLGSADSGQRPGAPVAPVEPQAGNRLSAEGFSFEDPAFDAADWEHEESVPRRFDRDRSFAAGGQFGVGFVPEAGEWARLASAWVDVRAGEVFRAQAHSQAADGCVAKLGLEFAGQDSAGFELFSGSASATGGRLTVASTVPTGYERVRAVLVAGAAGGAGQVSEGCGFDDVFLGPGEASDLVLERENESILERSASDPAMLAFDRLGQRLATLRAVRGPLPLAETSEPFELMPGELVDEALGVRLVASEGPVVLVAELLPALFGEQVRSIGCLTESGFRERSGEFSVEGVLRLRLGSGLEQLALSLTEPARVSAVASGEGLSVRIELGGAREFEVQLGFTLDRGEATSLAAKARRAERDGELGASLSHWQALPTRYPFEANLVLEAEASVARLSELGLAELALVRQDLERARFFQSSELFDACEAYAREAGERFSSPGAQTNAVEHATDALIEDIRGARDALPMRGAGVSDLPAEAVRDFLRDTGRGAVAEGLDAVRIQGGGR